MSLLPRFAMGTMQPDAALAPLHWGLLDLLDRSGLQAQCFQSRACFTPQDGAAAVTGLKPRHLDSWLMSRDFCREIFFRAAVKGDIAIVDGCFPAVGSGGLRPPTQATGENSGGDADIEHAPPCGGNLESLCEWLDLPRVVVLDASRFTESQWPARPDWADAVLLDRVRDPHQAEQLQSHLAALWNIPVLGWLEELPVLREMIAGLPLGGRPPRDLCAALGHYLAPTVRRDVLMNLASLRPFGKVSEPPEPERAARRPTHVAVAFDRAFHCYFPDMLDMLELQGAVVRDFSPLRDEDLPPDTDIVYLGCGHPQDYAEALSENHCLMTALRNHVCAGKRVYAESGGLAYLCRELQVSPGVSYPMVGALPAIARLNRAPQPPQPVALTLKQSNWLGKVGDTVRGYLNTMWDLEPAGPLTCYANEPARARDLVGRRNAIGSRLHLHFAAQPACFERFMTPLAACS